MEVKFVPLTFISESEKIKEQVRNTIIFQFILTQYQNLVPLGSLLSNTRYGYTTSAKNDGKFKLVRITDMQHGRINWENVPFCECERPQDYLLEKGDILVARTGGTVGKTFLIEEDVNNAVFASYLIRLQSDNNKVLPKYVFYFLNSYSYWSQISDLKSGSAQPNVNAEKLKEISIPYCCIAIQKKIINFIENNKNSEFENLKNILDKTLLSLDKLNELENININLPIYFSKIRKQILQEAFSKKSFSNNLEIVKLGDVVKLIDGKKISGIKHPYLEARYLRKRKEPEIISEGEFVEKNKLIILVDGENSGEVFELKEEGYLGSTFKILEFNPRIDKKYLQYVILLNKELYRNSKRGMAIPHLDKTIFKETNFPLPPLSEQKRIVEKVDKLMAYCDELEKQVIENKDNSQMLMSAILKENFKS